jgi:hypothetical protein
MAACSLFALLVNWRAERAESAEGGLGGGIGFLKLFDAFAAARSRLLMKILKPYD